MEVVAGFCLLDESPTDLYALLPPPLAKERLDVVICVVVVMVEVVVEDGGGTLVVVWLLVLLLFVDVEVVEVEVVEVVVTAPDPAANSMFEEPLPLLNPTTAVPAVS